MIGLIQRCKQASVVVEERQVSSIGRGLLIFLGISVEDSDNEAIWLSKKIANLRIFADEAGKMNLSILETRGEALVVSQFTLLADMTAGNRPSYVKAARPEQAIPLYELFISELEKHLGSPVKTGVFGADMAISLINDGPVTLWVESKK